MPLTSLLFFGEAVTLLVVSSLDLRPALPTVIAIFRSPYFSPQDLSSRGDSSGSCCSTVGPPFDHLLLPRLLMQSKTSCSGVV
jgi:hypothetical protein